MLFARFIKLLVGSHGAPSPILALPRPAAVATSVATSTVNVPTVGVSACYSNLSLPSGLSCGRRANLHLHPSSAAPDMQIQSWLFMIRIDKSLSIFPALTSCRIATQLRHVVRQPYVHDTACSLPQGPHLPPHHSPPLHGYTTLIMFIATCSSHSLSRRLTWCLNASFGARLKSYNQYTAANLSEQSNVNGHGNCTVVTMIVTQSLTPPTVFASQLNSAYRFLVSAPLCFCSIILQLPSYSACLPIQPIASSNRDMLSWLAPHVHSRGCVASYFATTSQREYHIRRHDAIAYSSQTKKSSIR